MFDAIKKNGTKASEKSKEITVAWWKQKAPENVKLPDKQPPNVPKIESKAKDSADSIMDTLRDRVLSKFKDIPRGKHVNEHADKIRTGSDDAFRPYTVYDNTKGPSVRVQMPFSVQSIVATELNSAMQQAKAEYYQAIAEANPKLKMEKTWRHIPFSPHSGYTPRPHHVAMSGTTIPFNQKFKVKTPDGIVMMDAPHDESAPVGEVINCLCDLEVRGLVD